MALADVRILTHANNKVIGIKSCKSPVTEGAHTDYRDGRDKSAMTSRNRHEFCPYYAAERKNSGENIHENRSMVRRCAVRLVRLPRRRSGQLSVPADSADRDLSARRQHRRTGAGDSAASRTP